MPTFCLSILLYAICMCMSYVYMPGMADVQKPSRVQMGCARPEINYAAVVYWWLNL